MVSNNQIIKKRFKTLQIPYSSNFYISEINTMLNEARLDAIKNIQQGQVPIEIINSIQDITKSKIIERIEGFRDGEEWDYSYEVEPRQLWRGLYKKELEQLIKDITEM